MYTDITNIFLALIEGFGLIISPCILPVLPLILAGSLAGNKKHSIGIVAGFVLAFALFTFFSRQLVILFATDLTIVRYISFGLLILFGLIMLSNKLGNSFARLTQKLADVGMKFSKNQEKGFVSGLLFGGLVGLIWTPCAGPILAAVIVQTIIQKTTLNSFLIILAFGIGAAIPMLLIALLGKKIMSRMQFFKVHSEMIRKILGMIIIASVFYMLYGESWSFSFKQSTNVTQDTLVHGLLRPYSAPNIQGIDQWINSPPLTIEQLKGKVVLIDFWAYSCINCIRTLPYLKDWYAKYHDKGFEIIGVHSPEFDFEKNVNNVKNAVSSNGIKYPVALDNQFVTWQNYNNHYWPAHYLIDKNGYVVYTHFGEGDYDITENNIRYLLGLNKTSLPEVNETASFTETPETYLGYARMENYASPEAITYDQSAIYHFPETLKENQWALSGAWKVTAENVSTGKESSIKIHFNARKAFVVMGSGTGFSIPVKIFLNDKLVENGNISVMSHKLYEAVVLESVSSGILQITAFEPGLEIYTFTFGE